MAKGTRLLSLDVFRGMTVAFMIIVNTPGSWEYIYPPLRHASWNGCTPTDIVFPAFLFIVGVSVWYSLRKYDFQINRASLFRIIRRMVMIFAIGLFLAVFPYFSRDYSSLRIMGVLQRIALAYGIGAIICLSVRRDYLWIVTGALLLIYWGIMALLGGDDPFSLEGNFALRVDTAILGEKHLYKGFGIPFDPEGLFSTIPAICSVIIGFMTGEMVGKGSATGLTLVKLLLFGIAGIGLGLLWNIFFPVNKPLWTSSYVLFTGGVSMVLLSFIYLVVDILKFQKWATFFTVFGTNALFAFCISIIWTRLLLFIHIPAGPDSVTLYGWFYEKVCVPVAGNLNGSLLFAVIQMLIVWIPALILFRKKIILKV